MSIYLYTTKYVYVYCTPAYHCIILYFTIFSVFNVLDFHDAIFYIFCAYEKQELDLTWIVMKFSTGIHVYLRLSKYFLLLFTLDIYLQW